MTSADLTAACLADLSTRGPRYTSYPAATELHAIDAAAVTSELAALRDDGPISLYVHVPFCHSLCWYCGCNVIPTRDATRGDAFVARVADELAIMNRSLGTGAAISEIALGGGSPNFLSPEALRALVEAIEARFAVAPDARRSIELDPRRTSAEQVDALAALGFRSLSVGVQDFAPAVQDAINRHQSSAETAWLINRARAAAFTDVNVDVVYGLPHQTEASFAGTLDALIALSPDRIALFGYAHLPSKLPHQRMVERNGRVLGPRERATLLLSAIERLTSAGYIHLGLDHFALPGSALARAAAEHRMVRTFQGYIEHRADTILGVGVSSISTTRRMFWQNHGELAAWQRDIAAGRLPVARGLVLDADDQLRRAVINELMCEGSVDLAALCARHGVASDRYFTAELSRLGDLADLATYDSATGAISTTPLGRLLVRNVCMVFDRYHRPADDTCATAGARFSSTI